MFTAWVSDNSRLQFLARRYILRRTLKAGKWLRSVLFHILLFAVKQFCTTSLQVTLHLNHVHTQKKYTSRQIWLRGWEAATKCNAAVCRSSFFLREITYTANRDMIRLIHIADVLRWFLAGFGRAARQSSFASSLTQCTEKPFEL